MPARKDFPSDAAWREYLRSQIVPERESEPEPEWMQYVEGPLSTDCIVASKQRNEAMARSLDRETLPQLDPDDPGAECDPPFED